MAPMRREIAYAKLAALGTGAVLARKKFGGAKAKKAAKTKKPAKKAKKKAAKKSKKKSRRR
jgi:hypothetical protein